MQALAHILSATSSDTCQQTGQPQIKRATVMGLGRFGGGVGVTRFLVERGFQVCVTDGAEKADLAPACDQLRDLPSEQLRFRFGGHDTCDFTDTDLVIANPAVKPDNPYLQAAQQAGVLIATEIQLLINQLPNPQRVIAVTGSAGKSTTTAMIAAGISSQARCHTGGNIGGSLLNHLDQIQVDDWVVLELSSFMLWHLDRAGWAPQIAVITNLSPNHLDWHGSMAHYQQCKQALLTHQAKQAFAQTARCVLTPQAQTHFQPSVPCVQVNTQDDLPLTIPGQHNLLNAQTALAAIKAANLAINNTNAQLDITQARQAIQAFTGLPHRLCLAHEQAGVQYFDDSKCTTPEAAILALASFPEGVCRIILGGYDKGANWDKLAQVVCQKAKAVYTIGATGDAIAQAIENELDQQTQRPNACGGVSWAKGPDLYRCGDLETAMNQITTQQKTGDKVLLSPACASWDQFTDFQARGKRFVELAQKSSIKS